MSVCIQYNGAVFCQTCVTCVKHARFSQALQYWRAFRVGGGARSPLFLYSNLF